MTTPKVLIEKQVYQKIMHWVNKSDFEVSGLGLLDCSVPGEFKVVEAMLLPQKNGSTHTDIEADAVARLMFQLKDNPHHLRFWWHSHVNMAVFWSQRDLDTIKDIGKGGWFLSTVFNKKNEMRSAFYAVQGVTTPWGVESLFQDNLETQIIELPETTNDAWDKEYDANVSNVTYLPKFKPGWDDEWSGSYTDYLPKRKQVHPLALDDNGFDPQERTFMAEMGWDQKDIDDSTQAGFMPDEILALSGCNIVANYAIDLLQNGWTFQRIFDEFSDDMPVMDAAKGGQYDV